MTIETAFLISGVSVAFALYQGVNNMRRNNKTDDRNDAAQLTTVIVKLESIGNGVSEIKRELSTVKEDIKNDHERLIKVEESVKASHKRMDTCERFCKRFIPDDSQQ